MKSTFSKVYLILVFLLLIKVENDAQFKFVREFKSGLRPNIMDTMTLTKPNVEYVAYEIFKDSTTGEVDSINAEYAIKQIYLESGHLKSFLCSENNNLVGMKHPRVRATTSLGKKNGYAHYETWIDCVKDLYLWRKANNLIGSTEEELLKSFKKYAQDSKYGKKLARISTLKDDRTDI
jgi:uncharacterized FlgJ-related protein